MKKTMITKMKIAHSLKQLLLSKDFKKITTEDIAQHAGVRRQTFYNHFLDKYQVVEWIFISELEEIFAKKAKPVAWQEVLAILLQYLDEQKVFYQKAFEIDGQNAFRTSFQHYCLEILDYCYKNEHHHHQAQSAILIQHLLDYHTLAFSLFIKEKIYQEEALSQYHFMLCSILEKQFKQ
ncbi:transcriptional regulator, TetR family [Granulicatella balaenopterae]|uniref:Transcriptional regulator, TetR family n=1 Tax=Granulicatella balaenopterae TaxID=137733 RepID=A0A1H9KY19_9LACT|nr:TetR family transcriptional regulator [Granulicatella balaenopterae]SER03968.1 transcriptional regulator, TetR family [Granulicatella balaenopterae]